MPLVVVPHHSRVFHLSLLNAEFVGFSEAFLIQLQFLVDEVHPPPQLGFVGAMKKSRVLPPALNEKLTPALLCPQKTYFYLNLSHGPFCNLKN